MSNTTSFANQFLIAMPALADPNFYRAVTYICEHNEKGAIGIIINRPLDLHLDHIFKQINIDTSTEHIKDIPVLFGGPVQPERGFVIHQPSGSWQSTLSITDTISVSTSKDILHAIAENRGPKEMLIALGYAAWENNQIEQEMANNFWLNCPADPKILFHTPFAERWQAAGALIGIDINTLTSEAGHA